MILFRLLKFIFTLVFIGIIGFLLWFFYSDKILFLIKSHSINKTGNESVLQNVAQNLRQEIFSEPLRSNIESSNDSFLTHQGVISLTNAERVKQGASVLAENQKLDAAAKLKLDDMFKNQYFEHVSPSGHGPSYLADTVGYGYVVVGENLALGNFDNDQGLLDAWMASPGHKANILNSRFVEIGVAVGRGVYQGRNVWMAVQEFGKPASDCPNPDPALKIKIDADEKIAENISDNINILKQQLSTMPKNSQEEQNAYNQKVAEYNALIDSFNTKQVTLKSEISVYNTQVRAFNACIQN